MSRASRLAAAAMLLVFVAGCAANPTAPTTAADRNERTAVLLTINDVYRIEGVDGGTVGSIARVRTLRERLEREHPDLLVLHAGDLLFPSFLSRTFNGEQMIDVLNGLDGNPTDFDERMYAVFGNHEFEKDQLKDAALLDARVEQSQFRWVNGNVEFKTGSDGQPLVAADNLMRSRIVRSGGLRIGLFGLTVDVKKPQYSAAFQDPIETARQLTAALRQEGAEVVVALTHLNAAEDRRLLATLGADGPDLVVGGHDHEHMACDVGGRKVLKADADARTANVVRLTLGRDGKLRVENRLEPLASNLPEDDRVAATAEGWLARHEQLFCSQDAEKKGIPPDPQCLEKKLGSSRVTLVAEENKIRGSETNLGDWVADQMVAAFASCGAQAAFVNAGSLRLNQDVAAGPVTRRTIEELFAYPAPLYLLRVKGSVLQQVAARAIVNWPGSGNWLQISGFSFVHDTTKKQVSDVELVTPGGRRPVQPDEEILVVTNNYLFDPTQGDQDGYTMLDPSLVVQDCAVNGKDLKEDIVISALQAAEGGIAPATDGRIRQIPEQTAVDPCSGAL
jgi:2',3'-cyclic-nucleotide 2'-phosphodiesterase (5'-nucleotidase family)